MGENGENVGDAAAGMMLDESGGDKGRCAGGVTAVFGEPHSEEAAEAGERMGEVLRGDCCPYAWSDAAGDAAETVLFSTSRRSDERNAGSSAPLRIAAAVDVSGWSAISRGRRKRGLFSCGCSDVCSVSVGGEGECVALRLRRRTVVGASCDSLALSNAFQARSSS